MSLIHNKRGKWRVDWGRGLVLIVSVLLSFLLLLLNWGILVAKWQHPHWDRQQFLCAMGHFYLAVYVISKSETFNLYSLKRYALLSHSFDLFPQHKIKWRSIYFGIKILSIMKLTKQLNFTKGPLFLVNTANINIYKLKLEHLQILEFILRQWLTMTQQ